MSEALQRSLNVPAVQVLQALTPAVFYGRLRNAGLDLRLPVAAQPNLSLALGGASVSLASLSGIYAALGRQGRAGQPRWLAAQPIQERYLLSEQSAWVIHHILRSPVGQSGSLHRQVHAWLPTIAYKTGTSYGNRDAWAIAVTADYTLAVWVGRPDGSAMIDNTGRLSAVPLLARLLNAIPRDRLQPPVQPVALEQAAICWPSGQRQNWLNPAHCHRMRQAWLVDGVAPPTLPGSRAIPAAQGACAGLWPLALQPWLPERWQREQWLGSGESDCNPQQVRGELMVEGLLPGAVLSKLPGASGLPPINLSVLGVQGNAHWFLNDRWLASTQDRHQWTLTDLASGDQRLLVMDEAGQTAQLNFQVVEF
jgi:penicillin-binding protein 1C